MIFNPMTHDYAQEIINQEAYILELEQELIDARGHGDLSENAEYSIAQHNLTMAKAYLNDLEIALATRELNFSLTANHYRVEEGATVYLDDLDTGEREVYTFVPKELVDPLNNLLSTDCQLFKTIKGLSEGDEAVVRSASVNRLSIVAIY
jgi:transcription elongation factor GreA